MSQGPINITWNNMPIFTDESNPPEGIGQGNNYLIIFAIVWTGLFICILYACGGVRTGKELIEGLYNWWTGANSEEQESAVELSSVSTYVDPSENFRILSSAPHNNTFSPFCGRDESLGVEEPPPSYEKCTSSSIVEEAPPSYCSVNQQYYRSSETISLVSDAPHSGNGSALLGNADSAV